MFQVIPDAKAILRRKGGLYFQADVYRHKERLFVKFGSGYAFLHKSFEQIDTSVENLTVDELVLPFELAFDKKGYVVLPKNWEEK